MAEHEPYRTDTHDGSPDTGDADAPGLCAELIRFDTTNRGHGDSAGERVRNSTTPTLLEAGYKVNVIPGIAHAQVDTRVLPGTEDELLARVDALLGPGVEREFIAHQPAVHAPVDSPWFTAMADALRAEDPEAVVVPYCMGGGTDAKAFSRLGIACFGSPRASRTARSRTEWTNVFRSTACGSARPCCEGSWPTADGSAV